MLTAKQQNFTIDDVIQRALNIMTPPTDDQQVLNAISAYQLKNATCRTGKLFRDSFDGNLIVPLGVARRMANHIWKYPPFMHTEFKVRGDVSNLTIKVRLVWGVFRYLEYREFRTNTGRPAGGSSPRVQTPEDFGTVTFEGIQYDLRDGNAFRIVTTNPIFYSVEFDRTLYELSNREKIVEMFTSPPQQETVLQIYDSRSGSLIEADFDANGQVQNLRDIIELQDDRSREKAWIRVMSGSTEARIIVRVIPETENSDTHRVTLRSENTSVEGSKQRQGIGRWLPDSWISPVVSITIENGEFVLPPQQYEEARAHALAHPDSHENPYATDDYTQINCVLTRSTQNRNQILATTFGVFDTLRDIPRSYRSIDEIIESNDSLLEHLTLLTDGEKQQLQTKPQWMPIICSVLRAAQRAFVDPKQEGNLLYLYQWDTIQLRIQAILNNERNARVIKAPTGAGKTVVFMVNAALHSLLMNERAVLGFSDTYSQCRYVSAFNQIYL